ncbi:MAG: imidazole glycerol phosphate synthase subunit HisH [Bacteroidetes bacterium]|nr:imidazole glycerol phosphate synthase subunit HisH [Bacteroidota bacterium]
MVGIIDYEAGNIRSVVNALKVLGVQYVVSNNLNELMKATKIILPGVGEARSAMLSLQRVGLIEWIKNLNVPFLGICLGMQILFESSTERNTTCLGIVNGTIDHFSVANKKLKIPHMGWNDVHIIRDSPLFAHIPSGTYFYFVHSYFAPRTDVTIGETTYGVPFASAIHYKNFYGVQFHPEKSSTSGLQLLKNFVELC